jgi:hypothetical protein
MASRSFVTRTELAHLNRGAPFHSRVPPHVFSALASGGLEAVNAQGEVLVGTARNELLAKMHASDCGAGGRFRMTDEYKRSLKLYAIKYRNSVEGRDYARHNPRAAAASLSSSESEGEEEGPSLVEWARNERVARQTQRLRIDAARIELSAAWEKAEQYAERGDDEWKRHYIRQADECKEQFVFMGGDGAEAVAIGAAALQRIEAIATKRARVEEGFVRVFSLD